MCRRAFGYTFVHVCFHVRIVRTEAVLVRDRGATQSADLGRSSKESY